MIRVSRVANFGRMPGNTHLANMSSSLGNSKDLLKMQGLVVFGRFAGQDVSHWRSWLTS